MAAPSATPASSPVIEPANAKLSTHSEAKPHACLAAQRNISSRSSQALAFSDAAILSGGQAGRRPSIRARESGARRAVKISTNRIVPTKRLATQMSTDPLLLHELDRWASGTLDWVAARNELEVRVGAGLRLSVERGRKDPLGSTANDMSLFLRIQNDKGRLLAEPFDLADEACREVGEALAQKRSLVAAAIASTPAAVELMKTSAGSFFAAWERSELGRG